jgi:predicted nucleotidyltransferase
VNPRAELGSLTRELQRALGDALVGVYAHGSFALGCFNPALSDLDVLVVTRRALKREERRTLGPLLGRVPRIEIHFLTESALRPWRHPATYDLHFGSELRVVGPGKDHDLAAHVTVARHAGIALVGPPPIDVLPEVPWADYEDSLRRDLEWCGEHGGRLYTVLSPARIWATLAERVVHSKASGAAWALERAPQEFQRLLSRALEAYRTGASEPRVERKEVRRFAEFVTQRLAAGENLAQSRDRL